MDSQPSNPVDGSPHPPEPTQGAGGASTSGAPPAAAQVVLETEAREGDAEEIVRLRRENAALKDGKKKVEVRAAELEDENRRLKAPPEPPKPHNPPRQKTSWLNGGFFD